MQDHAADRDTPDSFVPSSSPESVVGVEVSRYPDLSLVKQEPPEPVPSPIIPILPSIAGKGRGTAWLHSLSLTEYLFTNAAVLILKRH